MLQRLALGLMMTTSTVVSGVASGALGAPPAGAGAGPAGLESHGGQPIEDLPGSQEDLDDLRSCQAHAQVVLRGESGPQQPPAAGPDLRALRERAERAESCAALARRVMVDAGGPGGQAAVVIELAPGLTRDLAELGRDLEAAARAAAARRALAQKEHDVARARWLRVLFGDRLRVFNQHPEDLPDYDGKARGPLPASVAPRWRYRDQEGKGETFLFRGNRLIRKIVQDSLRS